MLIEKVEKLSKEKLDCADKIYGKRAVCHWGGCCAEYGGNWGIASVIKAREAAMLYNIRGSVGLTAPGQELARPELAVNAPDPVLGQPVEQEVQFDEKALRERADELSLSNAANTIEIQRGVRQNEALTEVRDAAETALNALQQRVDNVRELRETAPQGSVVNVSAVQPTLEVITQELNNVVNVESVVYNELQDQEGNFFSEVVPDLTSAAADEEVVGEALAQVQQFINSINQEIENNRTVIVNTGAEMPTNAGNQVAAPEGRLQPITDERVAQQVRQEAVQQIQEQADIAIETQNNLSTGTLLELYNS